jgi:hypothetical protein
MGSELAHDLQPAFASPQDSKVCGAAPTHWAQSE